MEKSSKVLVTFLIVSLLVVMGVGGYFIFKMSEKIDKQTDEIASLKDNKGNIANNDLVNDIPDTNPPAELDPNYNVNQGNSNLVYDAEYTIKELEGEKYYSDTYEKYYSLDDIVVPYINIDSEDVKKINEEIEKIYNEQAEQFKSNVQDAKLNNNEFPWWTSTSYEVYTNDNVLSVLITTESGGTDQITKKYNAYNIDLQTLKCIEYKDLYKIAGLTDSNINEKVENAIKNIEQYSGEFIKENFEEAEISEWIDNSITNYKDSVSNNSIVYFLDETGTLQVVVLINLPMAGSGEFNEILEIK